MATIAELLVKIGADTTDFNKKTASMQEGLKNVGATMTKIGAGLSVALTAPLLAGAAAGFKFSAQMEDFQANFETLLGSADKAKSMIAELTTFAAKTPFEMTGLADAAKVMLNFGVPAKDVMNNLKMMGDVAMGNQDKLKSISLAFGQIMSTGRLMGQDLLQLINAGFNPLQTISEQTGRSMADLKKDMENGAISAEMVTEAFKVATSEGGRFYGAMDKGSKTFNGQMSTLKDTVNITLGGIMKPLFENLSQNVLPKVIKKVEEIGKWFAALSAEQKNNIFTWLAVVAAIGPVLVAFGAVTKTIGVAISAIKAVHSAFTFLAANPVVIALGLIVAVIGLIIIESGRLSREVRKTTNEMIANYKEVEQALLASIDNKYAAQVAALENEKTAYNKSNQDKLKIYQEDYDENVKNAGKVTAKLKENLQQRQADLKTAYDENINLIRSEYGVFDISEKTKTQVLQDNAAAKKQILADELANAQDTASKNKDILEKAYQEEIKLINKRHTEAMKALNKEYEAKIKIIDAELSEKVKQLKAQINAIDAQTEAEEKAIRDAEIEKRIEGLRTQIAAETNADSRIMLEQRLQDILTEQERERLLESREDQKAAIQTQIDAEIQAATDKKTALDIALAEEKTKLDTKKEEDLLRIEDEKLAKIAAEDEKLATTIKNIDATIVKIDEALLAQITSLQKERIAKEEVETAKYNAANKAITDEELALEGHTEWLSEEYDRQLKNFMTSQDNATLAYMEDLANRENELKKSIENEKQIIANQTQQKINNSYLESLKAQLAVEKNKVQGVLGVSSQSDGRIKEIERLIANEMARLSNPFMGANVGGGVLSGGSFGHASYAVGTDYVPHDMLAYVHQGEKIIPANKNGGITINITDAMIMDDYGVDRLMNTVVNRMRLINGVA
jgi:tape measure domain-containing protein